MQDTNLISTSRKQINWKKYKRSENRDPEPDFDDFIEPEPIKTYRLPVDTSPNPGTKSLFNTFKIFSEYYENHVADID